MPENCSVDLFLMILLNVILKNRAEQNRTNLESFLVYIILDVVVLVRPRNWENLNSVHELKQEERNRERERDGDVRRSQEEKQSSCVSCKSRDSRVSVLSHGERWKKERERDWGKWVTEDAEDGVSYVHLCSLFVSQEEKWERMWWVFVIEKRLPIGGINMRNVCVCANRFTAKHQLLSNYKKAHIN